MRHCVAGLHPENLLDPPAAKIPSLPHGRSIGSSALGGEVSKGDMAPNLGHKGRI